MSSQPRPHPGRIDIPTLLIGDLLAREGVYGRTRITRAVAHAQARREQGIATYGTALQSHNGRDAAQDLIDEQCDATHYARQRYEETGARHWWLIYERQLGLWLDTLDLRERWSGA